MDSVKLSQSDPDRMLKLLQAAAATTDPMTVSTMSPNKMISAAPNADSLILATIATNEYFSGTEPDSQIKQPADSPTLVSSASLASMSSSDEVIETPKNVEASVEYIDTNKQTKAMNAAIVSLKRMRYHTHQIGKSVIMGKLHDVNNQISDFQEFQRDAKIRKLRNEDDAASTKHDTTTGLSDKKHIEEMEMVDLEIFRRSVLRNASNMKHLANLFRDLETLQGEIIRELHLIDHGNPGLSTAQREVTMSNDRKVNVQYGKFLPKFPKSTLPINLHPRFVLSSYAGNYDTADARVRRVSINSSHSLLATHGRTPPPKSSSSSSSSSADESTDVSTLKNPKIKEIAENIL
jgi:hypothetical protein